MNKPIGAGIILLNHANRILLILRDNDPAIPYPNQWDLPGGHVEAGETPEQAVRREMNEELELDLGEIRLFKEYHTDTYDEYVFLKNIDLEPRSLNLHEGQCIAYFSRRQIEKLPLAYSYNKVLREFFESLAASS